MAKFNDFLHQILTNSFDSIDVLKQKYPSYKISLFKKGSVIISKGTRANKSYFLIKGTCDISNESDFTDLNVIDTQIAPNVFGYYETLTNYEVYTSHVIALTDCYIYEIDSQILDNICQNDARLCHDVMKLLVKDWEAVQIRTEQYHLFSGEDIVGYYLYNKAKEKTPFVLDLSREEFSRILYINLRTLYRYIDKLEQMNYLTIYKRKIIINEENYKNLDSRYHNVIL